MGISDILAPEAILPAVKASGKKQALREIGHAAAARYGLEPGAVIEGLLSREKLGSTAMGSGVAIPHTRIEGVDRIIGIFARMQKPIEFDAADGQAVDLMFALLAPVEAGADHLRALAKVSRLMRDPELRGKLRASDNAEALFALMN